MNYVGAPSRRRFAAGAIAATMVAALPAPSMGQTRMRNSETHPERDAMATLTPYILFDGNCKQAMEFYQSCLGGELTQMKVGDSSAKEYMPAYQHHKIVNARLKSGNIDISASDWLRPDRERFPGNTVCLYLNARSPEELRRFFERLSEGADIADPLKEVFFGTYGALNDKFGVRWMFHCT